MKLERIDLISGNVRKVSSVHSRSMNTNINFVKVDGRVGSLDIDFEYSVTYKPDGSQLFISGKAAFSGPESKKCSEEWSRTGRIGGAPGELILNAINYSASINAIFVARAFNLTPPVVLPTLTIVTEPSRAADTKKRK
jgi:hypothetical protein